MMEIVAQIGVLLAFVVVLFGLNLKAGSTWLKVITLWSGLAALAGAAYLTIEWVFL